MRQMVPAALRYADQVARSGSIQGAAKELNIAASAIDRQILLLETTLGVQLFERMPRGMRLTAAGDAVIALARRWRVDERRVVAELRQMQGVNQGHVRIAAMDSHANGFLPDFVEGMARDYPRISLDVEVLSTDDAVAALMGGSVDVAAVFNMSPRRDAHVLWRESLPFGCVVHPDHPLARRVSVSLQEAVAYPVALQSKALMIRRYLDARHGWLLQSGASTIETNSLQLVKMLARSGGKIAFTSELDAAPEILEGSLVFLPVRDEGAEPQTISIAIDSRKPLQRIVRLVADRMAETIAANLERVRRQIDSGPRAEIRPAGEVVPGR